MRVWDRYLSERDRELFPAEGRAGGFGQQPALVIIDVTYAFTGEGEPIRESIKRYPLSCGEEAWSAIRHTQRLLEVARAARIPIYYTITGYREDAADEGAWRRGHPGGVHPMSVEGSKGTQIVAELAPAAGEFVIAKKKPSAFFGTPLVSYLIDRKVDTLIVTGCTTSGCIRSSVLDAFSLNYKIVVPEECSFDRGEASHAINLYDLQRKYADVIPTQRVIEYLEARISRPATAPRPAAALG